MNWAISIWTALMASHVNYTPNLLVVVPSATNSEWTKEIYSYKGKERL